MRFAAALIWMLLALEAIGQNARLPLDIYSTWRAERSMMDSTFSLHPEVRPYSYWTVQRNNGTFNNRDAMRKKGGINANEPTDTVMFVPRINGTGLYESGSNGGVKVESYIGANMSILIRDKIKFNADVITGYNEPLSYIRGISDSLRVVPGYSHARKQGGLGYYQTNINLAWRPNHLFELQAGRGKHFIGEGYRSVFLSDYAPNYNYLRADVDVWRIKYMVLYTQMLGSESYPNGFYPIKNKYNTMHYLSLNITKWWSVGAFEAVVWESEDSVNNREFDINYLNPIIFFRPIEYSIGSSDNSLLGFSSTIRPSRGLTLYGQLMIDELIIKNALAPIFAKVYPDSAIQTGWFGNKQAFQLGAKYHEPFKWKHSTVLAEVNVARPYIYGHANQYQSYTHMNQPLAHPLGANFIEWVAVAMWQPADFWHFGLRTTYARKGYTNALYNMGEDPSISSFEVLQSNKIFGYDLLQGSLVDVANIRLEAAYTLVEKWNLRIESAVQYRYQRSQNGVRDMTFFSLGLRTALWNDYKDL